MVTFRILLFSAICINMGLTKHCKTIRTTQYGLVRGKVAHSRANSTIAYYSFQGIQYARPALKNLRFKEPQPPRKWTTVRDATQHKQICLQFANVNIRTDVVGSEDCLYLEVYIPITARKNSIPLPVMVWFHAGNWVYQSTYLTAPDYLMEKPVVVVEVGYRLNVFGFFTTLDDNAKGNLGLKDQVLALKWVQRNIHYFDGDPSKVTLFGVSAGGASILYHMLSPLSKGLFMQGISGSGSPLTIWAVQRRPLEKTYLLARHFGIASNDSEEIVQKLQEIDAEELFRAALSYSVVGFYTPSDPQPFASIIERDSKTAFISESAYDRLVRGDFQKIPLIIGSVQQEAASIWTFILQGGMDINIYQREPERLIPETMNIPPGDPCINITLRSITQKYFPDGNYTRDPMQLLHYLTLRSFVIGIMETARLVYVSMTPVRFYQFTFVGSRTRGYFGLTGHLEDLVYLFYPQGFNANPNETVADRLTRNRMITLWTNFAITGNPTPQPEELLENVNWPTVNPSQNYLDIGTNLTLQSPLPYRSDREFWHRLYQECGFHDPNNPNTL